MSTLSIHKPAVDEALALVPALADMLIDCTEGGASLGFMLPLDRRTAEDFYRTTVERLKGGGTVLLVAFIDREPVGMVLLSPATMPNQRHRADVQKLLVHRHARNRGIASALMAALEEEAAMRGLSLLCLDTATGSSAELLYERLGWQRTGVIPRYARWPEGGFCDTTLFWKDLTP